MPDTLRRAVEALERELSACTLEAHRAIGHRLRALLAVPSSSRTDRCVKCDRPMEYVMTCPMCGGNDANILSPASPRVIEDRSGEIAFTDDEPLVPMPKKLVGHIVGKFVPAPPAKRYRCRGCGWVGEDPIMPHRHADDTAMVWPLCSGPVEEEEA